jgi:hypothetical protein
MNFHANWADEFQPLLRQKGPRQPSAGMDGLVIRREEARCSNTREGGRQFLHDAVFPVTYRGRTHDVIAVNLSGGGAMIACSLKPTLGEHLHLHLGEGGGLECVVRWVKDGRIGLEFAHETQLHCSDEAKAKLLREVIDQAYHEAKENHRRGPSSPSDKRSSIRHPLIWAGEIICGPSSWPARLRNVSETGALVECSGGLQEGSEVVLDLREAGVVAATVTWSFGDHLGLRFDEQFDVGMLAKARPRIAPPSWLRPAYLEDAVAEDSAWDDSWSRMSVDELRQELEGYLKW